MISKLLLLCTLMQSAFAGADTSAEFFRKKVGGPVREVVFK